LVYYKYAQFEKALPLFKTLYVKAHNHIHKHKNNK
jgi:hypothetical protein